MRRPGLLALAPTLPPPPPAPPPARPAPYDIPPADDLFARLGMLQPGDEVVVHAGTYATPGFFAVTWAGTAAAPTVVRQSSLCSSHETRDPKRNRRRSGSPGSVSLAASICA